MQGGAGLALLAETIGETVSRAGDHPHAKALSAAVDRVVEVTTRLWSTGDPELALANATVYLEALGHVVVAWIWLEQLLACEGKEGAFYDGKRAAAEYFFAWELPRTGPQLDLLASLDRTTLDMQDAWF
jgi:butyryl-CoA dehydrogenase